MLRLSFAPLGGLARAYQRDGHGKRDRLGAMLPAPILPTLPDCLKPKGFHYPTSSQFHPSSQLLREQKRKRGSNMAVTKLVNFVIRPCSDLLPKGLSKLPSWPYFPFFLLFSFFSFHYQHEIISVLSFSLPWHD